MQAWRIGAVGTLILGALGGGGYTFFAGPVLPPRSLVGQPAPQFAAPDIHAQQTIELRQFRGKVLVLNFWASWCEPCREEHAYLLRLKDRFADQQGAVLLGVAHRDRQDDAREFLRRWGEGYPHLADPNGNIGAAFGVTSLPQTLLIDASGVLRCRHFGPVGKADLEKIERNWIRPALEGRLHSCN